MATQQFTLRSNKLSALKTASESITIQRDGNKWVLLTDGKVDKQLDSYREAVRWRAMARASFAVGYYCFGVLPTDRAIDKIIRRWGKLRTAREMLSLALAMG